ncbi:protein TIFY 5A [Senna tora]|uniref:Protein TIFY 5A n=1 Tax=Senna tora TaxID=362788 RepID=A0A834SH07_9FABA|nr:protein TIFY 5A [Senna tora]
MRRNSNLQELCLFPSVRQDLHNHRPMMEEGADAISDETPHQNLHKLTIFYDGKMCVSDVTDLQEKDEKVKTPNGSSSEPSSPSTIPALYSPNSGLSMKRSLQRFLQKRKNRIQEASPYHHH